MIMKEKAWLKGVLADAKAAKQSWPDWAKKSSVLTSLNSHPGQHTSSISIQLDPPPIVAKNSGQDELHLK